MRCITFVVALLLPSLCFAYPIEVIDGGECVWWEDDYGRHPCPAPEKSKPYFLDDEESRCALYMRYILPILEEEGVDERYYALAVAESRCKLNAVSNKGAVGFWQMTPSTMKAYGCENYTDLVCQTRAAARYLLHIQSLVGDDEEKIVCGWNMGTRNYMKRGATKEARGLYATYKKYKTLLTAYKKQSI